MKAPAFQFYVKDWRTDANLRRCSPAARGVWMDVLCLLHDSDEYGILRWPLREIALAAGASAAHLKELVAKDVLRGSDTSPEAYVWAPTHAGKAGEPVTLVAAGQGPCWYSRRFVKDEHVRQTRGASTRFTTPTGQPNDTPTQRVGERQGCGASTASASASSLHLEDSRQAPEISPSPTAAGLACLLMRQAGCVQTNPSHPDLIAALAAGVTPQALADTVAEAIAAGIRKPFAWAIATARGRHAEQGRPLVAGPPRVVPAAPLSKTAQAFLTLEGMKSENRLDSGRDSSRTPKITVLVAGTDAGQ